MDAALKIAVVEDHDALREITVAALQAMGHEVRGVSSAEEIDELLAGFPARVLVLDLNLPGEDGLSLGRRLREAQPGLGIVMVTARDQVKDVLRGYKSGADIYLAKPTSPEELGAAIQALVRRLPGGQPGAAGLTLDMAALQLRGPAAAVDVSMPEAQLLAALARAAEHRLETWQLLEISGKSLSDGDKKALAVQVVRLRKKLGDAGVPEPTIKAVRGTGYQLCVPLSLRAAPP